MACLFWSVIRTLTCFAHSFGKRGLTLSEPTSRDVELSWVEGQTPFSETNRRLPNSQTFRNCCNRQTLSDRTWPISTDLPDPTRSSRHHAIVDILTIVTNAVIERLKPIVRKQYWTNSTAVIRTTSRIARIQRRSIFGLILVAGFHVWQLCQTAIASGDNEPAKTVVVSSQKLWTQTGITLRAGQPLTITASGQITAKCSDRWGHGQQTQVGPAGTYLVDNAIADQSFPLPAGSRGPAPCYALIGRIGDGDPFFVGQRLSWTVRESGRLFLGINDFQVSENSGQFTVKITRPGKPQPIAFEQLVDSETSRGRPVSGCSVVVFYIDGLRPDVVREMAAMGHIPTIRAMFLAGGTWLSNTFTAFPSDTITSNGTMWTGCFSDRHGLKAQVRFSRRRLVSESYLEPLGPGRGARLLKPQGIDRLALDVQAATRKVLHGADKSAEWKQNAATGIPPIYHYLRSNGQDWATGVLPLMTDVPPLLWTRSMARHLPVFQAQKAWQFIDDANTTYAMRHLLHRENPVTIVWLPETDSVSHRKCRGQFGTTRRTIAWADQMIAEMVADVRVRGRFDKTYFLLVSDHGHHGGRATHLSHFDIANELFFAPRIVSEDRTWVGGGLGMSVRQHRSQSHHPEDRRDAFVFIDGDSDGAARIFLPRRSFQSGDWTSAHRPADLLAYNVASHLPALNLLKTLTAVKARRGDGTAGHPIDLVLMKLSDNSILVSTSDRGHAVIERKRGGGGQWLYRYQIVTGIAPAENGSVSYAVDESAMADPLGLLKHIAPGALQFFYDERIWLKATTYTQYPDSIVALTRHMLWQDNLKSREAEYAPDLVVTARPGWFFGTAATPGTTHGYPLADSMRACWFVSGPNVLKGARVEAPSRLVDLTPTILDMIGLANSDADFDGVPIRSFYASPHKVIPAVAFSAQRNQPFVKRPVFWEDVDLNAWRSLDYNAVAQSKHVPYTINRPDSAIDLNNILYNFRSIGDWSVFRLFDDLLLPITRGRQYVAPAVERSDLRARQVKYGWVADGAAVFNISDASVADYSLTSTGNIKRVDGVIDWFQERGREIDTRIGERVGRVRTPRSRLLNQAIDATQFGFWEVFRFAQRIVVQLLDETVLNGVENSTDKAVNTLRRVPAEIVVDEGGGTSEPPRFD